MIIERILLCTKNRKFSEKMSNIFRAVAAKQAQVHGFNAAAISSAVKQLNCSPALEKQKTCQEAIQWLEYMREEYPDIRHAENSPHSEKIIGHYHFDGFSSKWSFTGQK